MLAVVAFPVLAEADGRKIEAIRRQHDPSAKRIAAHFTLVFPTSKIAPDALEARVDSAAAETAPFTVGLRRILVHQKGNDSYVFLVPEQGYDALVAIHARLNNQDTRDKRPFTPHVTVARLADRQQARRLATALASEHLAIGGRIDAVTLVEVPVTGPVRPLHSAALCG
ncbi:MAG TPA: 2'-5' RNA ligase family protein [Alphaproteobacteria bacterium]|nr:2'-5' RNA ligase family protein [Alphaproteobacteria bacterium]